MKELEQFLLDRAMEHDSPTLLFNLAREYLASAKAILRPDCVATPRPADEHPGFRLDGWLI